jgi:hypothetical protein
LSPAQLKVLGTGSKKPVYPVKKLIMGGFERKSRGIYAPASAGRVALEGLSELAGHYRS